MITLVQDDEYKLAFGNEPELEDVDVDRIVDKYVKMGPPDPKYMDEVRTRWEVKKSCQFVW